MITPKLLDLTTGLVLFSDGEQATAYLFYDDAGNEIESPSDAVSWVVRHAGSALFYVIRPGSFVPATRH